MEVDVLSHEAFAPDGDVLRWIATHLQLADRLTKSMNTHLLNETIRTNVVIVLGRAPDASTSEPPTTDTTTAQPRHSSEEHQASHEATA